VGGGRGVVKGVCMLTVCLALSSLIYVYIVLMKIIILIIIIILDAIYALFLKSSKRGALYKHERSRVTTHNKQ
jgi:hypothetical protein